MRLIAVLGLLLGAGCSLDKKTGNLVGGGSITITVMPEGEDARSVTIPGRTGDLTWGDAFFDNCEEGAYAWWVEDGEFEPEALLWGCGGSMAPAMETLGVPVAGPDTELFLRCSDVYGRMGASVGDSVNNSTYVEMEFEGDCVRDPMTLATNTTLEGTLMWMDRDDLQYTDDGSLTSNRAYDVTVEIALDESTYTSSKWTEVNWQGLAF